MRKKWTALAVALCMLLSGCGGTGAASSAPESAPAAAETSVQNEAPATETTELRSQKKVRQLRKPAA